MEQPREKFATQMDAAILAELRLQAKTEGRQIQSLIEEAVSSLLAARKAGDRRTRIMELHEASVAKYEAVYKKLAE
tara:strand:- start:1013 stop:1240 length:228 start_codon:yes stop_codon:yes gene_type:complete